MKYFLKWHGKLKSQESFNGFASEFMDFSRHIIMIIIKYFEYWNVKEFLKNIWNDSKNWVGEVSALQLCTILFGSWWNAIWICIGCVCIYVYIDGAYVWAIMSFAKLTPCDAPPPRTHFALAVAKKQSRQRKDQKWRHLAGFGPQTCTDRQQIDR